MTATLAPDFQRAVQLSTPKLVTPAGSNFLPGQLVLVSQIGHAGQDQISPQANASSTPNPVTPAGIKTDDGGQGRRDAQHAPAPVVPLLDDPTLALAADMLDDLERVKIASQNRLRSLTDDTPDADGVLRGSAMPLSHPEVARLAALVQMVEAAEHQAVLNLQRAMRSHPLGPWVKAQRGIGEKQAARLLAKIGDPCVNATAGTYRTVSQLWAYCGLHVVAGGDPGQTPIDTQAACAGVAARRQKGQKANWSTDAKTRAWLIVQSCMKQLDASCKTDTGIAEHVEGCGCSPYRVVIDQRRQRTATTHPEWTPGHSLNDAMRVASKRLLRDLWREARRCHGFADEGSPTDITAYTNQHTTA